MKTQAQRLPVDVKVTDLEKLRDTRAQKRAEDEAFSYNPQRLGMFLSIEARSKFKRLLDEIKQHIKTAEHKAAIK